MDLGLKSKDLVFKLFLQKRHKEYNEEGVLKIFKKSRMKYHCTGCGYIYDEILGDEDMGIPPHTFFEYLPSDFFCPYCETHKDDFVVFEEYINYLPNPDRLTNLEAEHFPVYKIEGDKLVYEIGQIEHPSSEDHFIYQVAIFDDSGDLIEKKYFEVGDELKGVFDIEYIDSFEIRVYCSRDGVFSTGIIERGE